jgi:hypothetical protein
VSPLVVTPTSVLSTAFLLSLYFLYRIHRTNRFEMTPNTACVANPAAHHSQAAVAKREHCELHQVACIQEKLSILIHYGFFDQHPVHYSCRNILKCIHPPCSSTASCCLSARNFLRSRRAVTKVLFEVRASKQSHFV